MKLIENWKNAWKYWSVQLSLLLAVVGGALQVAQGYLPELQKLNVPVWVLSAIGVAYTVVRVLQQKLPEPPKAG